MAISRPVQNTYPYSNSLTSTGTLVASVTGKSIVGNIVVALNCFSSATSEVTSATVSGTQNGNPVSFTYSMEVFGGNNASTSMSIPLPKDLIFDVGTAITVTISAPSGYATVSIGYYLK